MFFRLAAECARNAASRIKGAGCGLMRAAFRGAHSKARNNAQGIVHSSSSF